MADPGTKSPFVNKLTRYTVGVNRGPLFPDFPEKGEEEIPPEAGPLTVKQKIGRHFRRYWCCHVVFLIICLAILLPILFVFIVPDIAQDLLNRGNITITSAEILQPHADNVILTMTASIYIPGGFTVVTEPSTLDLFVPANGRQYPMGQLFLSEATIKGNTSIGVTNQFTPLINQTTWQQFVTNTIMDFDGPLGLYGGIDSHIGKLKADTTLDKAVWSNALNKFNGFGIDSATLVLPAESDGTNLLANATLPNPSVLTLEIGNATLNVLSGDLVIGTGVIENLFLRPGNNSISIRGQADLETILHNLPEILQTQAPYIKEGNIALTTRVTNITYEGVEVPYYTSAMSALPLVAEIPLLGLVMNTIKEFLSSPDASNGVGLLGALNLTSILNSTSSSGGGLGSLLNDTTALEDFARKNLENLMTY